MMRREPRQIPLPQHRHEFLEVVIILSGTGVHTTGAVRHALQAGDVLVISKRRPHGFERTQGLNLVNIVIREDTLPRLARDLRQLPGYHALFALEALHWRQKNFASRLRLSASELAQVGEWADRLESETKDLGRGGAVLAEAYLVLILGLIARRYDRPSRSATPAGDRMGRLLSWIEAHLHEALPVARLAKQAGMSERSFYRKFISSTGLSPLAYLLRQRISLARELLLADSSARIGEVATACGFEDSNYFSRVFHVHAGVTPRGFALRQGGARG